MATAQRQPTGGSGPPPPGVRRFSLVLLLSSALLAQGCGSRAAPDRETTRLVLAALESTFTAMKERDYAGIYSRLSAESRASIVEDTRKAIAASGGGNAPPEESIARDFREGGPVARAYWDGFLRRFDPEAALSGSRWEMGEAGTDEARVLITREGADRPAVIRMYREGGAWKVGLRETFRHRPVN